MKTNSTKNTVTALLYLFAGLFITSCELVDELDPESETEKTVKTFTGRGQWKVDTLDTKTDLFSAGVSNVTSDSTFLN